MIVALVVSAAQLAEIVPKYSAQFVQLVQDAGAKLESLGVQQQQVEDAAKGLDPSVILSVAASLAGGAISVISLVVFIATLVLFIGFDATKFPSTLTQARSERPAFVEALGAFALGTRKYMSVSAVFGLIALCAPRPQRWLIQMLAKTMPNTNNPKRIQAIIGIQTSITRALLAVCPYRHGLGYELAGLGDLSEGARVIAQAVGNGTALSLPAPWNIVALVSANAYVVFFGLSWGPMVWVLLGEMFPNRIRAIALAVAASAQWLANFLITATFPSLAEAGLSFAYGLYAAFAVLSLVFVVRAVRETKGMELEAMRD